MLKNSYTLQVLERTYSRPTILGMSLLEPILAVAYIVFVSSIVLKLLHNKPELSHYTKSNFIRIMSNMTSNLRFHPINNKSALSAGFTIIEVLIVLAIAGLILLIVFLSVPALQRSQRNNARKVDAGRYGAAIVDFVASNPTGSMPSSGSDCDAIDAGSVVLAQYSSIVTACNYSTGATLPASPTADTLYLVTLTGGTPTPAVTAAKNDLILGTNAQCSGTSQFTYISSGKKIALLYSLEQGSSNWTWACQNVQ